MRTRRGGFLTAMAILLALAGIVDFIKALTKPPPPGHELFKMPATGMVVLGVRHTGSDATILGLLVGAFLFFYAVGIWRMKRYAVTVAWIYAAHVMINVTLFTIRNPAPPTTGARMFALVYSIGAIMLTAGTAIALTRRGPDLA